MAHTYCIYQNNCLHSISKYCSLRHSLLIQWFQCNSMPSRGFWQTQRVTESKVKGKRQNTKTHLLSLHMNLCHRLFATSGQLLAWWTTVGVILVGQKEGDYSWQKKHVCLVGKPMRGLIWNRWPNNNWERNWAPGGQNGTWLGCGHSEVLSPTGYAWPFWCVVPCGCRPTKAINHRDNKCCDICHTATDGWQKSSVPLMGEKRHEITCNSGGHWKGLP